MMNVSDSVGAGKPQNYPKWSQFLSNFMENYDHSWTYDNELLTQKQFYGSQTTRKTLTEWLNGLKRDNTVSEDISHKYRETGNDFFRRRSYAESVVAYTRAIFTAPKGNALALAHANRSAALIKMGQFEASFDDCQLALSFNYPENKKSKVLLRRAKCASQLNLATKLKEDLDELRNRQNELDAQSLRQLEDLEECFTKMNVKEERLELLEYEKTGKLQKCLKSENRGRFVVAEERIESDEVIIAEAAYAVAPINFSTEIPAIDDKCHNCASDGIIPFPCYDCRKATYCSSKCRTDHQPTHAFDCPGYKTNLLLDIGIAHLALSVFLTGFDELVVHLKALNVDKLGPCNSEEIWSQIEGVSSSNDFRYSEVLQLESNLSKLAIADVVQYALTASMIVCYLKESTKFFNELNPECRRIMDSLPDWEMISAALILRHIGQMICNAHTISHLGTTNTFVWTRELGALHQARRVAPTFAAIYPKISLYNHSCEPNFRNCFNGRVLTAVATKKLEAGDEILNCYGPHFKREQREDRLRSLREQYAFKCDCLHCTNGSHDSYSEFHKYKCQRSSCGHIFTPEIEPLGWWRSFDHIRFTCPSCCAAFNVEWYSEFQQIVSQSSLGNELRAFEIFESAKKWLIGPHELKQEMSSRLVEYLFKSLKALSENRLAKLVPVIVELLTTVESQFGKFSLEYVAASTYALDLMAWNKHRKFNLEMPFDSDEIQKSFEVLSTNIRKSFLAYINEFIKSE